MRQIGLLTGLGLIIALSSFLFPKSESDFMISQFAKLESHIPKRDSLSIEVSKADVAWHLDHTLKVINSISKGLINSEPSDKKVSVSLAKTYVFTSGKIPRGRAQAPKSVTPPEEILTEDLYKQLKEAKEILIEAQKVDKKIKFEHPVFGVLSKRQTLKFIKIHTNHHLSIIHDVLQAAQS